MKTISTDGIIFDVDGTLWDTTDVLAVIWNDILRREGVNVRLTAQDLKNTFGLQIPEIGDRLLPDLSPEERRRIVTLCCLEQTPALEKTPGVLFDGIRETLQELKKRVPLYIVSNCETGYIETLIETCHLDLLEIRHWKTKLWSEQKHQEISWYRFSLF